MSTSQDTQPEPKPADATLLAIRVAAAADAKRIISELQQVHREHLLRLACPSTDRVAAPRPFITVIGHRVELPEQRRYETVVANHAPTAEDAAEWQMRRGERAIFQTTTERRYQYASRLSQHPTGMYATDDDPADVVVTATWIWTGRTWKRT